jgi:hypothetical protein
MWPVVAVGLDGGQVADESPRASRLATPSWLDARLVVGVVLVMLAVVIGARLFASADRYTEVYVARSPLVPGEHLSATDLSVGEVRFGGEGASYVAAGRPPVGYVVTRYVGVGEFVPLGAVSATPPDAVGDRLVTVPVDPGHFPVDVYLTVKPAGAASVPPPTRVLSSVPVDSVDDGSGSLSAGTTFSVVLAVPGREVDRVVHAVQSGLIDLVRVPSAAAVSAPSPAAAPAPASVAAR